MAEVSIIGLDLGKHVFEAPATAADGSAFVAISDHSIST